MDRISAPEQNRILGGIANLLRKIEQDSGPEFLPKSLDVMGLVRQLALPSAETVEKLSYGDPLFRMPTQSNIPITTDRGYLAEVLGMAPVVPAVSRATTRISNEMADQLVKAITRNPEATAVRALDEIGRMSPVPQITTYHGSPYLFRQFDPSKVGTGEGAQAYGVGSGYTAEARPVAEGYARNLTTQRLARDIDTDPQVRSGINLMQTAGSGGIDNLENMLQTAYGYKPEQARETVDKVKKAIGGYLYKGEIPDEILPRFLDWDKKFEDQSPEVKEAVKKYWEENKVYGDPSKLSGAGIYDSIVAHVYGDAGRSGAQQAASSELEKAGLRGIRYLDEGSRGSYKAQLTYKGQPYSDVIEFKTQKQLDDYIKENEEKGFGVQTFRQTSNFVTFRPEDYRIQEINDRPIEEFISQGLL